MDMLSLYSENSTTNFSLSASSPLEIENSQQHHTTDEWTFDQELIVSSDCVGETIKEKEVTEMEKPQTTERPRRPKKRGIPWTEDEHKLFLMGLQQYGKGEWKNISRYFVTTKTPTQVASHGQKFKNRMHSSTPPDKRRPSINDIKSVDESSSSLHPKRCTSFGSTTNQNVAPSVSQLPIVDHQLPPPHVYNNNNNYCYNIVDYPQERQNLVSNGFRLPVVDQLLHPHVYNNNNYCYNVDYMEHQNLVPNSFQPPVVDKLPTHLYNKNYCFNADYKEGGATTANRRGNNFNSNSITYQTWANQY